MKEELKTGSKFDLEGRLIDFSCRIIDIVESLPNTRIGNHIASQLVRSGTSSAPNYGEAQAAESRNDFIHKMKVALKELRETYVWLRIVQRKALVGSSARLVAILTECNELISIFVASIATTKKNMARQGVRRS